MQKSPFILAAAASLIVSAHATDLNGSDWHYNYSGHYSLVGANVAGLSLDTVANLALVGQLGLLNGTITSNCNTSINQTSNANLTTGNLEFDAHGGTLLLPAVKNLVYNLLDANDGNYTGTVSGNTLHLSKTPVLGAKANALGIIDTRVLGLGVVVDLQAAIPTNSLTGTIDGFDAGTSLPFGTRGNHVTGTSGLMDTIQLQARTTVYTAGLGGIHSSTSAYANIGVIQTTADSWSFSRSPQAVPEPGTFAALGLGALGILKRRRKAVKG